MKKSIKLLFIMLLSISILSLNSCKKDDNGNVVVPKFSLQLGSDSWNGIPAATLVSGKLNITASNPLFPVVYNITVNGTELKTYELKSNTTIENMNYQCFLLYKKTASATGADLYFSYDATVTITKYDATNKLVSGTFTATVRPSSTPLVNTSDIKITNGKFENVSVVLK